MIVADVYRGGRDSAPSNHVDRIPPKLTMTVNRAIAVPRRMRGAVLFAIQAPRAGGMQYVPVTERKRDPYRT